MLGVQDDFTIAAKDALIQRSSSSLVSVDPKYTFDITAPAGNVVAPSDLVCGLAGCTTTLVRTTLSDVSLTRSHSKDRAGWTRGGGFERVP
jgi:outer membrane immunogenic protein